MRHSVMRSVPAIACGMALALLSSPVAADAALEQSCSALDVFGANQVQDVAPLMAKMAARWPEQNRVAATNQISGLLEEVDFSGGNVYELARLGEDFADHLVVLRLAAGETIGLRLTYEWTPDALALTRLDIKLDYATELGVPLPVNAEPKNCP